MTRAPLTAPFSPGQDQVVRLIAAGWDFHAAARNLEITYSAVVDRARKAGQKIPGDIPDLRSKIICWSRGATIHVLGGQ